MSADQNQPWDDTFDVIVVGSGNGALTAAVVAHDGGANTLIIEKSEAYGGTSATSGGGVWIPNNRYAKAVNADDSPEQALTYLKAVSPPGKIREELLETYVEQGPKMIDYLHEHTRWVRYETLEHYPDYFPEAPGGKTGHRSMEPTPIHCKEMGEEFYTLRAQHPQTQMPFGVNFTQLEGLYILSAVKGWFWLAVKLVLNFLFDFPTRFKTLRDGRMTMGGAGVARLRMAVKDRDIPLWLHTRLEELVVEDGRVVGIIATKEGRQVRLRANKGVILAAGGFEHNQQMRDQYLKIPTRTAWSAANIHNTGDAIRAAQKLGAATHQMDWNWWFTTAVIPGREKAQLSQIEKGLPGTITVNKNGQRFSNESQNYVTFVQEMQDAYLQGNPCIPCYMIFDADFRYKRPLVAGLLQGKLMPDWMVPRSWWRPEFVSKADTIEALAAKVGIDPQGLASTIATFNDYARTGKDLDFQRGDSSYDRYYSDPEYQPNPCLGALSKPPFYCITLYPGDMGTAGGLVVDTHARVLNEQDEPIAGLYACGNTTTALLPRYPGPGSTLGPAMTFGYLAGRHITGQGE